MRLTRIPFSFRRWLYCLLHGHTIRVYSNPPDHEYCQRRRETGGYIPFSPHSAYQLKLHGSTTFVCVICGHYTWRRGGSKLDRKLPTLNKTQTLLAHKEFLLE